MIRCSVLVGGALRGRQSDYANLIVTAAQRSARHVAQSQAKANRPLQRVHAATAQPYVQVFCRMQRERKATDRARGRKVSAAVHARLCTIAGSEQLRINVVSTAVHFGV